MATIKEDYVSFETAKLMKEKGFDRYTLFPCYKEDNGEFIDIPTTLDTINYCFIPAPTLQMAMKWLLKKYNIFICVLFFEESGGYGYTIEDIIKKKYIATSKNSSYKEPEKASETAIKHCLEHLIK